MVVGRVVQSSSRPRVKRKRRGGRESETLPLTHSCLIYIILCWKVIRNATLDGRCCVGKVEYYVEDLKCRCIHLSLHFHWTKVYRKTGLQDICILQAPNVWKPAIYEIAPNPFSPQLLAAFSLNRWIVTLLPTFWFNQTLGNNSVRTSSVHLRGVQRLNCLYQCGHHFQYANHQPDVFANPIYCQPSRAFFESLRKWSCELGTTVLSYPTSHPRRVGSLDTGIYLSFLLPAIASIRSVLCHRASSVLIRWRNYVPMVYACWRWTGSSRGKANSGCCPSKLLHEPTNNVCPSTPHPLLVQRGHARKWGYPIRKSFWRMKEVVSTPLCIIEPTPNGFR